MDKITKMWVFVVNENGKEKIVTWPNAKGVYVPLVYFDQQEIENDKMRIAMQAMADLRKLYFELRTYQLVEKTTEKFYPTSKEYNA